MRVYLTVVTSAWCVIAHTTLCEDRPRDRVSSTHLTSGSQLAGEARLRISAGDSGAPRSKIVPGLLSGLGDLWQRLCFLARIAVAQWLALNRVEYQVGSTDLNCPCIHERDVSRWLSRYVYLDD